MATYAVGDLQGCLAPLQRLLDEIRFDPARDRLWFVGDIVNRGPDSLASLRFVKGLGDAAVVVLGNHDLHLLCVAEGYERLRRGDTLAQVLDAPDRGELLGWLRRRPMLCVDDSYALVHAGLLPAWTVERAPELAGEVEAALRVEGYRDFLAALYGDRPDAWDDALTGFERLRVIVNALTRLRFCTPEGRMEFAHTGGPEQAPAAYLPWFRVPGRRSRDATVVCGHWSALGLRLEPGLVALDTGCVWGGSLTAVRLEDRRVYQVPCAAGRAVRR